MKRTDSNETASVKPSAADVVTSLPQFVTVRDIAKLTRRSTRAVYEDIAEGRLPAVKFGRAVRIREADFLRFVGEAV